jgi:transposase
LAEDQLGTDSEAGGQFVKRVLTVVASCRQQGRDVLAFLTDAIQAASAATTQPADPGARSGPVNGYCSETVR